MKKSLLDALLDLVALQYGIERDQILKEGGRTPDIVQARQTVCYLLFHKFRLSSNYIAGIIGITAPAVSNAVKAMLSVSKVDRLCREKLEEIERAAECLAKDHQKIDQEEILKVLEGSKYRSFSDLLLEELGFTNISKRNAGKIQNVITNTFKRYNDERSLSFH